MFAKMINETTIEKAPRCIHVGNLTFVMPSAEQYAAGGYYEVETSPEPIVAKWYRTVPHYEVVETEQSHFDIKKTERVLVEGTEDDYEDVTTTDRYVVQMAKIVQTWNSEKVERPDYSELIVGYIRERYSLNDELALQRQWDNTPAKKQEFNEYNDYCDECKVRARADLAEYDAA